MRFKLNNADLPYGGFTVGDLNYPANVLTQWSDADLAEIGVVRLTDEVPSEPTVPETLTASQFRRALLAKGLLSMANAAVAGSGDEDLQIHYEYTTTFHRHDPIILRMISAIGKTSVEADAVWSLGATLT